jgi:hypothetical protein
MVELTLTHDGGRWVAMNELLAAAAPTLEELDSEVGRLLKRNGLLKTGEKLRVFMAFDNSTIPQWIRQYAQHYFNRVVDISG